MKLYQRFVSIFILSSLLLAACQFRVGAREISAQVHELKGTLWKSDAFDPKEGSSWFQVDVGTQVFGGEVAGHQWYPLNRLKELEEANIYPKVEFALNPHVKSTNQIVVGNDGHERHKDSALVALDKMLSWVGETFGVESQLHQGFILGMLINLPLWVLLWMVFSRFLLTRAFYWYFMAAVLFSSFTLFLIAYIGDKNLYKYIAWEILQTLTFIFKGVDGSLRADIEYYALVGHGVILSFIASSALLWLCKLVHNVYGFCMLYWQERKDKKTEGEAPNSDAPVQQNDLLKQVVASNNCTQKLLETLLQMQREGKHADTEMSKRLLDIIDKQVSAISNKASA